VVKVAGSADKRLLSPGGGEQTQEEGIGTRDQSRERTDQAENRTRRKRGKNGENA
jgi:hypothetical protein